MVLIESGGCTTGKVKGNLYPEWKEGANNESSCLLFIGYLV